MNPKFDKYGELFIGMMNKFETISDDPLHRQNVARHRIELASHDVIRLHSAPYSAGPRVHDFENTEIDGTLKREISEPNEKTLATPIVFDPNKDRFLAFVSMKES